MNNLDNKHIAIVGCGWVGRALADQLVSQHIKVTATTTSDEKLSELRSLGCIAQKLLLPESQSQAFEWLSGVDTLMISITPRFKRGETNYPEKVAQLVANAEQHGVENIILLSSSGVYNGLVGEVDETTRLAITEQKVGLLHQAEHIVLNANTRGAVLRLAGLVGPKRHPARFMAGKTNLANANTPTNLVHLNDVLAAINLMLSDTSLTGIYNVVSDTHPSREQFYTLACQQQSLELPQFNEQQESALRVVKNDKIKQAGLSFEYPDLITWLQTT
ncbi:SDR family oxidoreductase [Thalassotalea sp. M1531]|uniref:SDR family oxidoreductase n=1 Tax=Thalassotalea algicola TaxID=2716224 RepID=A0A7Y0LFU7_9GAMM|nr:SDR family oxidoreductase [Thalassotalea algicola]NMP33548.1 SDR family oxidoreductase [Thalassotalea algicola]